MNPSSPWRPQKQNLFLKPGRHLHIAPILVLTRIAHDPTADRRTPTSLAQRPKTPTPGGLESKAVGRLAAEINALVIRRGTGRGGEGFGRAGRGGGGRRVGGEREREREWEREWVSLLKRRFGSIRVESSKFLKFS